MAVLEYEWRGAVAELMNEIEDYSGEPRVLEYLVEGPRGTGKSRGVAFFLFELAERYSDARILVIRKTRESLTETFCKTFEEDICPGHSSIGAGDRTSRHHYQFPNGSRIVLGGLDKPTKHQSSDWDVIFCEEAVELTWKAVEPFFGSLRNWRMPFQLMLYACNPDAPTHWLNQRAEKGLAKRLKTRHKDNPLLWDLDSEAPTVEGRAFLNDSLKRYTGTAKKRHVDGIWAGAEGAVWENYDPEIHVIDASKRQDGQYDLQALGIKTYIGGMDWGYTAPGSLSVYGRDGDKRLIRVAGVYRTKQQLEWWAERLCELDDEFALDRVMCDPSRPDAIELMNDWLVKHKKPRLCEPADNKKAKSVTGDLGGLDLVRWGLEKDETGIPRIRFLKDALRFGVDTELLEANQPTQGYDEIPGYTFARDAHGEIIDDRTDPDVPDHMCFPAGTPVACERGPVPIERVEPGEMVWTPVGLRRVIARARTSLNAHIHELETVEGRTVQATGNHPFWSNSGWIRLDALRYGDSLYGCETGSILRSLLSGAGSHGGATRRTLTGQREAISGDVGLADRSTCTGRSTNRSTDHYPRGSMFITGTGIPATTPPRTSSRSGRAITSGSIHSARSADVATASCSTASGRAPQRGIALPLGKRGIASMPLGGHMPALSVTAPNVESVIRGSSALTPGFARTNANRPFGERPALTTSTAPARRAVRNSASIAIPALLCALDAVASVRAAGRAAVYNLTVEGAHVYFAGGLLVSNCDELRYVCAENWKRPVRDRERVKTYGYGTLGDLLGHEKELRRSRRVRV